MLFCGEQFGCCFMLGNTRCVPKVVLTSDAPHLRLLPEARGESVGFDC